LLSDIFKCGQDNFQKYVRRPNVKLHHFRCDTHFHADVRFIIAHFDAPRPMVEKLLTVLVLIATSVDGGQVRQVIRAAFIDGFNVVNLTEGRAIQRLRTAWTDSVLPFAQQLFRF
jgi:hypothetical protein